MTASCRGSIWVVSGAAFVSRSGFSGQRIECVFGDQLSGLRVVFGTASMGCPIAEGAVLRIKYPEPRLA